MKTKGNTDAKLERATKDATPTLSSGAKLQDGAPAVRKGRGRVDGGNTHAVRTRKKPTVKKTVSGTSDNITVDVKLDYLTPAERRDTRITIIILLIFLALAIVLRAAS